jgi:hypothetical protein
MVQAGAVLGGRWELVEALGEGGFGKTWIAREVGQKTRVVAKLLDLGRAESWKAVELFEREAQVLRNLDHDGIPSYLDAFEEELEGGAQHVLVQRLAPGRTLEELVRGGWHPSMAQVVEIARALLEVLAYLQALNPPLVHRDIKPANVLWDRESGRLSLVDFGAVKVSRERGAGGSTMMGTFGYMAPEQFRGRAEPATDLYGVGATLLYLLTHEEPSELPMRGLGIDVAEALSGEHQELAGWLERMVAPDLADRFHSAEHARERLDHAEPDEAPEPVLPRVDPPATPEVLPAWRKLLERAELSEAERAAKMPPASWRWVVVVFGLLLGSMGLVLSAVWGWSWLWGVLGAVVGCVTLLAVMGELEQGVGDPQVMLRERWWSLLVGGFVYFATSFLAGAMWQLDYIVSLVFVAIWAFFGLLMFYLAGGELLHMRGHVALERASGVQMPLVKDGYYALRVGRWTPGEALEVCTVPRFGTHAWWTLGLAILADIAGAGIFSSGLKLDRAAIVVAITALGFIYALVISLRPSKMVCERGVVRVGSSAHVVRSAQDVTVRLVQLSGEGLPGGEGAPAFEVQARVGEQIVWRCEESHEVVGQALARWLEGAMRGACTGEVSFAEAGASAEQADQEQPEEAFWRARREW